jgi:hypothetical protein
MSRRIKIPGFSLVEVILAVGIFALSVPTTLALLTALGRQSTMGTEALVAQRLPDPIRLELARLARTDFESLAAMVPLMTAPPGPGLALVASRDGTRLHSRDYLPPGLALAMADQYFLIECWRFEEEPLRFGSQKAFLALAVRVSWPYHLPDGTIAATEAQSTITFTVVLNR